MIVCSCNVLSDGEIRACVNRGPECPRTASEVYQCLGCSPKCGRCARTIRAIVANALGVAAEAVSGCATECASVCPLGKAAHAHGEHGLADSGHAHVSHDHSESHAAERFIGAPQSIGA